MATITPIDISDCPDIISFRRSNIIPNANLCTHFRINLFLDFAAGIHGVNFTFVQDRPCPLVKLNPFVRIKFASWNLSYFHLAQFSRGILQWYYTYLVLPD